MNNITYLNKRTLANIANAIRVKSESTNNYYPNQMANAILAIGKTEDSVPTDAILSDAFMLQPNLNIDSFWVDYNNNTTTDILISDTYSSLPIYADIRYKYNAEGAILSISNFYIYANTGNKTGPIYLPHFANYTFMNCNSAVVMQPTETRRYNTHHTKTMFHTFDGVKVDYYTIPISDNVTNMTYAFANSPKLSGSAYCGYFVTNMAYAYYNSGTSINLFKNPNCGRYVRNMAYAYAGCSTMTGSPTVSDNVIYMQSAYSGCHNLTGTPVIGSVTINADHAYSDCWNIYGRVPSISNNLVVADYMFAGCRNLYGPIPRLSNNLFSIWGMFSNCSNINGYARCEENIFDISNAYEGCTNLTGGFIGNTSNLRYMVGAFNNSGIADSGGDWYLRWNDANDNSYVDSHQKNGDIVWCVKNSNGNFYYTVYANSCLRSRFAWYGSRLNIHVPANGAWNNYLYHEGLVQLINTMIVSDGRNSYYEYGNHVALDEQNHRYCLTGEATGLYGHNVIYNIDHPVGNVYVYYDL